MLRKPIIKVPKQLYSEKFRKLPFKQKLAVRRKIGRTTLAMQLRAQRLDKRLEKWHSESHKEKSNRRIETRKRELEKLRIQFDKLTKKFSKFTDTIAPYFTELKYSRGLRSFYAINPIELKLHTTYRIFGKIQVYLETAELTTLRDNLAHV